MGSGWGQRASGGWRQAVLQGPQCRLPTGQHALTAACPADSSNSGAALRKHAQGTGMAGTWHRRRRRSGVVADLATSSASSASSARWQALKMAAKVKGSGRRPPSAISHTRETTSPSLRRHTERRHGSLSTATNLPQGGSCAHGTAVHASSPQGSRTAHNAARPSCCRPKRVTAAHGRSPPEAVGVAVEQRVERVGRGPPPRGAKLAVDALRLGQPVVADVHRHQRRLGALQGGTGAALTTQAAAGFGSKVAALPTAAAVRAALAEQSARAHALTAPGSREPHLAGLQALALHLLMKPQSKVQVPGSTRRSHQLAVQLCVGLHAVPARRAGRAMPRQRTAAARRARRVQRGSQSAARKTSWLRTKRARRLSLE